MSGATAIEVAGARRMYKAASKRGRRASSAGAPADGVLENGRRVALDGVSLRVEAGAWLALLGPNGSGKSTLLRLLATLETPDAGSVRVLGEAIAGEGATGGALASVRRRLGVVFQSPGLDPLLTVRENLACQAALHGLARDEAERRIDSGVRELGVADRLGDRVGRLSGGLARRVDLCRALLPGPEVLLLDEATGGLDHESRAAFLDALARRRVAGRPLTIVMTTHLMDEAERAGSVALLDRGRIVAEGSPAALRAELGGLAITTQPHFEPLLRAAGLRVARAQGASVGSGDADAIELGARTLARAGASFRVGPPTLGDVYLARTGRPLVGATQEAAP